MEAEQAGAALKLAIGRIARRLRQSHEVGDVTLSEVSVLVRLEREGPGSPGVLAEAERVRPQAMATTLAGLEERGLVKRRADPADGRRAVLSITPAGRKVIQDRRSETIRRMAEVLASEFSPAERRRLVEVIPLLDRLADRL